MKSFYYQFLNFVQNMSGILYGTIWILLLIMSLVSFVMFWKNADAEKREFKRPYAIISAVVFFLLLILWSSMRK